MNGDIKEAIAQSSVCAEFQANNPKEPMQTSKVPDRSRSLEYLSLHMVMNSL